MVTESCLEYDRVDTPPDTYSMHIVAAGDRRDIVLPWPVASGEPLAHALAAVGAMTKSHHYFLLRLLAAAVSVP